MSMENRDGYIWCDGEIIPWRDARLHILSYTVQHGAGVFEGIRAYYGALGTSVFRLNDHVQRLFDSAKILQIPMPYTVEQLTSAHLLAIRANSLQRCYVRTNVAYDGKVAGVSAQGNDVHIYIAPWEWEHYMKTGVHTRGARVKTSSFNRIHVNSLLRKAKANGHYVNSMLAVHEAKQQGYDDALLLDTNGYVAECSTSNIFVIRNGRIATPERVTVLEGITRDTVITLATERGFTVEERRITRDEVYCADEVFITGTAAEITPIIELDNRMIGSGGRGPITEMMQTGFFDAANGRDDKHLAWLTPLSAGAISSS
jgi:branched-chain amino acid aminotransferase